MGFISKFLRFGAVVALVFAVLTGLLFSGTLTQLGFFLWLTSFNRSLRGLGPAFLHGVEWGFTFEELAATNLVGQTALVTGGNSGVGFHAAVLLARQGASVTIACRSPSKCNDAATTIRSTAHKQAVVDIMILDTSSLSSVRAAAAAYLTSHASPLDMLLLNAGIASDGLKADGTLPLSEDGIELVFATNHVGHHLLYKLIAPRLQAAKVARIVLTSSAANYDSYSYGVATDLATLNNPPESGTMLPYGQSKLAQVLWAQELTRQLGPDSNIFINSCHPGAVDTGIWAKNPLIPSYAMPLVEYMQRKVMWTGPEGALTMLYLAVATEQLQAKGVRGKYYQPQSVAQEPNDLAQDLKLQQAVWAFSDELISK